jgi:uncharacterized Fe-S cluster-containing radical SAM superfamily protein
MLDKQLKWYKKESHIYYNRKKGSHNIWGGDKRMNELDVEHRLTEVEQRAKSNQHRLEELEPVVKEIHTMSNTMIQLVEEVKHTNETVASLDRKVDKMDSRVDEMENAPGKEWSNTKRALVSAVIGGIVTFLITGLLYAAVQAF